MPISPGILQAPGPTGDVGAQAAAARRREEREAGGRLRVNAFELIASSFNVSYLSLRGIVRMAGLSCQPSSQLPLVQRHAVR